eukprot:CAMPEP_0178390892 /NCGR_PEP_ID=MMETSP0689_2-20121128/10880_1 /TAXON_ID=160604 /ORGANISM="Amphidinium massartii, Strain CS-259" /LENGTH=543 /DNA_ID=CAMNT_0020011415 /DNA_START=143 /DNA_END=1770 /DNA_ORIENTATION=-
MAATVIVATVTRMCLDCLGFLLSGQQNASSNYFWFSTCIVDRNHLQQSMTCLHMAAYLFVTSILFCAVVLWGVAQWITDPDQNPYARRYSFTILVDSLTWIPISVCVGKMNVLVDWLMGVTKDNATRALLTIECVIVVSGVTALVANLSLKYVQDVANASKFAERSFKAFCRVLVLTTLSTFPWAVGWNAWKVVLAVLDLVGGLVPASAAEWQKSVANYSVLGLIMMATMLFYSRFGPEPVIPDPHTQQVVNRNPHTGSVLRSMIALMVYSCCVFNVMVITDPTYGILYKFLRWVHPKLAATPKYRDVQALVTLFMWILVITFLCVIASVIITACTSVDMSTSAKVSRRLTVTSSGRQLFKQSPPAIGQRPFYSRQSSREAGFGQELQEELMPERCPSREDLANGDEAAGPSTDPVAVFDNDAVPTSPSSVVSMKICASIMIFDVLGAGGLHDLERILYAALLQLAWGDCQDTPGPLLLVSDALRCYHHSACIPSGLHLVSVCGGDRDRIQGRQLQLLPDPRSATTTTFEKHECHHGWQELVT